MNSPMMQIGGEVGKHSHEIAMNLIQLARVSMQANHVEIAIRAIGALESVASVQNITVRDCVFEGSPVEQEPE